MEGTAVNWRHYWLIWTMLHVTLQTCCEVTCRPICRSVPTSQIAEYSSYWLGSEPRCPGKFSLGPANLEWKFRGINISNFVYIHLLDQRGYTVKQSAVSFNLYDWGHVHTYTSTSTSPYPGSPVRVARNPYEGNPYGCCINIHEYESGFTHIFVAIFI